MAVQTIRKAQENPAPTGEKKINVIAVGSTARKPQTDPAVPGVAMNSRRKMVVTLWKTAQKARIEVLDINSPGGNPVVMLSYDCLLFDAERHVRQYMTKYRIHKDFVERVTADETPAADKPATEETTDGASATQGPDKA